MTAATKLKEVRLQFWLLAMDFTNWAFGFGSRQFLWAVERAGNATDWGDGAKCGEDAPW